MAKKSFIEEELAKEAKLRTESCKSSLYQRLQQLLRGKQKVITPIQESIYKNILEQSNAARYGIVLTSNEMREHYEYPTITDQPQQAGMFVMTKLQSTDGDEIDVPLYFRN